MNATLGFAEFGSLSRLIWLQWFLSVLHFKFYPFW